MENYINKVIQGDCLEVMKQMPDNSVDLIVTDPPYNLDYTGRSKGKFSKFDNDNLEEADYSEFVGRISQEMARVCKETSAVYLFIDWRNYPIWSQKIAEFYAPIKNCIVWVKQGFGLGQFYRYQHEFCLFAVRGGYKLNRHDLSDVWNVKRDHTGDYQHPTQKPVEVMAKIIQDVPQEAVILDPFGGSCTTAVACKQLKRNFICIEKEAKYVAICNERLAGTTSPLF